MRTIKSVRIAKISILKLEGISSKNFLWASRLWVGRRKEPILGYVSKNYKKKKNSGTKVLYSQQSQLAGECDDITQLIYQNMNYVTEYIYIYIYISIIFICNVTISHFHLNSRKSFKNSIYLLANSILVRKHKSLFYYFKHESILIICARYITTEILSYSNYMTVLYFGAR